MKITTLLLFVSIQYLQAQTWLSLSYFPGLERDDGVAVVVDNKAYVGTGYQPGSVLAPDFYCLNLSNLLWTTIAPLPTGAQRQYASAFKGNGSFYVVAGVGENGAMTDMYKYSIASNSWTSVAPKPGNGILGMCCFEFGDTIIFAGGRFQNGTLSNEVWEYRLSTDSWSQKNNFPFGGRWRASGTSLNNTGYLMFGMDSNDSFRKDLYKYNPLTDTWTKQSDFPMRGRTYAAMQGSGDKLVVFAGIDTLVNYHNDLWFYDPLTDNWTQGPTLPSSTRKGGMSVAVNNKFYYFCGITANERLKQTWLLDKVTGLVEKGYANTNLVFPNPVSEHLTIQTHHDKQLEITIYNAEGKEIKTDVIPTITENGIQLDLKALEKGVYFLEIKTDSNTECQKIIKN